MSILAYLYKGRTSYPHSVEKVLWDMVLKLKCKKNINIGFNIFRV